jgi:ribonuclease HI
MAAIAMIINMYCYLAMAGAFSVLANLAFSHLQYKVDRLSGLNSHGFVLGYDRPPVHSICGVTDVVIDVTIKDCVPSMRALRMNTNMCVGLLELVPGWGWCSTCGLPSSPRLPPAFALSSLSPGYKWFYFIFDSTKGYPGEGPNVVTIGSINITALETNVAGMRYVHDTVCDNDLLLDLVCCQETRIANCAHAKNIMKECGWFAHIGSQPPWCKYADGSSRIGYGGLMSVSRFSGAYDLGIDDEFKHCSKHVQHMYLGTGNGRAGLHILSLYLPAGDDNRDNRNEIMSSVFMLAATFGDVPCVLLGDIQEECEAIPAIASAFTTGKWCDALAAFYDAKGMTTPATFSSSRKWDNCEVGDGRTRIDCCIANCLAFSFLTDVIIRYDAPFSGHALIQATFDLEAYSDHQMVWDKSGKFSDLPPKPKRDGWKDANEKAEGIWSQYKQDFDARIREHDPDAAFAVLSEGAVDYLCSLTEQSPEDFKRGLPPTFKKQSIGPPKHAVVGQEACAACDVRLAAWYTRAHEAVVKHEYKTRCQKDGKSVSDEWKRKSDELLPKVLEIAKHYNSPVLSNPDDGDALRDLRGMIKDDIDKRRRSAQQARLKNWKKDISDAHEGGSKAKIYKWLKSEDKRPCNNLIFKRTDGSLTANVKEIHQLMRETWSPIYSRHADDPEVMKNAFLQEYRTEIDQLKQNCTVGPIDPMKLFSKCQAKNARTAGGLDGWSMEEIHRLPVLFWQAFASIVELAETGHGWPKVFGEILVASIPKPGPPEPLNTRGIGLTSLWYSVYASVRYDDTSDWLLSVLPCDFHGGLKGRSTIDSELDLSMDIEQALAGNDPILGIMIDRLKCFDLCRHEILSAIASELGLDPRIETALRSQYANLVRRFRIGRSIGEPFTCKNGLVQGCSLSVVLVNVLFAILRQRISNEVPTAKGAGYLDDLKIWNKGCVEDIVQVWKISERFDALSGQVANVKKSLVFSNQSRRASQLIQELPGGIKQAIHVKSLGFSHNLTRAPNAQIQDARVDSALRVLRKMLSLPLAHGKKALYVKTLALPRWAYGVETQRPSLAAMDKIRKATAAVLWGRKRSMRCLPVVMGILHDPFLDPMNHFVLRILERLKLILLEDQENARSLRRAWNSVNAPPNGACGGFIKNVKAVLSYLEWEVVDLKSLRFKSKDGECFNLTAGSHAFLRSELCGPLRRTMLSNIGERKDMVDVKLASIDVDMSLYLLKCGEKPKDNAKAAFDLLGAPPDPYTKGVVRGVLAGSIMDGPRLEAAGLSPSDKCNHCQADQVDDLKHIFWTCPKYEAIRKRVPVTQRTKCLEDPILSTTGLASADDRLRKLRKDLKADEIVLPRAGSYDASGKDIYTDGACANQQHPMLRLAGAGVSGPNLRISRPLPGGDQSALRAEIYAILLAIRATIGTLRIFSDCKAAIDLVRRLLSNPRRSIISWNNFDLWRLIQKSLLTREGGSDDIQVFKVKGHATDADASVSEEAAAHKRGNDSADELARAGAAKHLRFDEAKLLKEEWDKKCQRVALCQAMQASIIMARDGLSKEKDVSYRRPPACGTMGTAEKTFIALLKEGSRDDINIALMPLRAQYPNLWAPDAPADTQLSPALLPGGTELVGRYLEEIRWRAPGIGHGTPWCALALDLALDDYAKDKNETTRWFHLRDGTRSFRRAAIKIFKENKLDVTQRPAVKAMRHIVAVPCSGLSLSAKLLHPLKVAGAILSFHISVCIDNKPLIALDLSLLS